MTSLLEKLAAVAEHLPPSHTVQLQQIPGVLTGLVHLAEHGDGFQELLAALEDEGANVAEQVHDFFTADAEKRNEEYRRLHPDAFGAAGPAPGQPSYQELLDRLAALEQATGHPAPSSGAVEQPAQPPSAIAAGPAPDAPTPSPAPPAAPTTSPSPGEPSGAQPVPPAPESPAELPGSSASPSAPASPEAIEQAPAAVVQAAPDQPTQAELLQAWQQQQIQQAGAQRATVTSSEPPEAQA